MRFKGVTALKAITNYSPVSDVINEMLLEHKAPALDDIQKSLLERLGVHSEPMVKDLDTFDLFCFLVDFFVGVNLEKNIFRT